MVGLVSMDAKTSAYKPSPAWRERVPNGVRRVRVGAPDGPLGNLDLALTLTRLASLTTLSRQAGEG